MFLLANIVRKLSKKKQKYLIKKGKNKKILLPSDDCPLLNG